MIDSSLQQHPLSAAFPPLTADEYQTLVDSITDLGVQNAITIYQGQVLDGWNRYRAAIELDMDCPTRELESGIDPRSFVLAQNKARRHVTVAQMAMAAASVYEWKAVGRPSGNSALSAELKQSAVADQAGVSVRSLRQANTVMKDAVPAVVEAVVGGEIGLVKASAIAKLPKDEQVAAINQPAPKPRPAPAPAPTPVSASTPPAESPPPEYTELDAARDQIADLQAALSLANLGDVLDEDRNQAAELIEHLQGEVKGLTAQLRTVTSSRDFLMQENTHLKQQLASQRREIDRMKAVAA